MELQISNVSVSFRKKQVLADICAVIPTGVCGFVGENGAGKTTLFRSILGLQKYKGSICKEDITRVGYVPQKFECMQGLNVEDTLKYFCSLNEIDRKEQDTLVENVLTMVNLGDERKKKVRQLSGGMLRRLGIAQALLNEPQLLIMDEPTVGLDPTERIRLREIIRKLNQDRIVMVSSHEIYEMEQICDRILFLHQGNMLGIYTLEELRNMYNTSDMEQIYFKVIEKE